MQLFDTHCHPPGQRFAGQGIFLFLNALTESDWPALKKGAADGGILPFYGFHPWRIWEFHAGDGYPDRLEAWLRENPFAGVGEIGLDRAARNIPFDKQYRLFRAQLEVAQGLARPVSFHCVRAWGKFLELIPKSFAAPSLLHGFNGPAEVIPALLDRGLYFSFSRNILEAWNTRGNKAFRLIPHDRLLLETEFPGKGETHLLDRDIYIATHNDWYRRAAGIKGFDPEVFREIIGHNASMITGSLD
jgi:TatD DNase family protein